jgi:hypothetical protein
LKILGPKRDEVIGEWKKLHNGKLHNLYSSPDIIRMIKSRRIRWARHVARGVDDKCLQNFYSKLQGNSSRRILKNNIKMYLRI